MKASSIGLVLSVCLLGGTSVRADIITFDQFVNTGAVGFENFTSGTEAGFTITNGNVNNLAVSPNPGGGDLSVGHKAAGNPGTIIQIDRGGDLFAFGGLDLKWVFSANPDVSVTGYTGSFGGTVIGTESYGLTGGFVTHVATAGAGLLGDLITHLEINLGVGVGQTLVNNLNVAVPEPSSFAFLALVAT
ncbi:MAG: hypothetical protein ABGZ53_31055, partial [Fuerstiella sp.]